MTRLSVKPGYSIDNNTDANRSDVYQRITDNIVAQLEEGRRPWMQPWGAAGVAAQRPRRANGEPYRGVNTMLLWMEAQAKDYRSPHWMTYRQAAELGGQVRRGESATLVVYANTFARNQIDDKGEESERRIPFMKGYSVFNCDQIDGLPDRFRPAAAAFPTLSPTERLTAVDAFFAATGADLRQAAPAPSTAPLAIMCRCRPSRRSSPRKAMPQRWPMSSSTG